MTTFTFHRLLAAFLLGVLAAGSSASAQDRVMQPSRSETLLRKTFWIVHTMATPPEEVPADAPPQSEVGPLHGQYQYMLEDTGVMFAAGPVFAADGSWEGGMIVIRADNEEEARRIADGDPFHASGLRRYTLQRWMVNEGQIRVKINYSTGRYDFE